MGLEVQVAQPVQSIKPALSMQEIVEYVAYCEHVPAYDILSSRRDMETVAARDIARYLIRVLLKKSYPVMGRFFRQDHTTVLEACSRVAARCLNDPEFEKRMTAYVLKFLMDTKKATPSGVAEFREE